MSQPTHKTEGENRTKTVRFYPFVFTGNDPRKEWQIPLNEIKYNEQHDEKNTDDRTYSYYAYDHAGGSCGSREQSQACLSYAEMEQRRRSQRTLKVTGHSHQLDVNAWVMHTVSSLREFTVYPSPHLVLTEHGYTNVTEVESRASSLALPRCSNVTERKHYYAGAERLAARQGGGFGRSVLGGCPEFADKATILFDQSLHQAPRLATPPEPHLLQEEHPDDVYNFMMKDMEIPENLDVHAEINVDEFLDAVRNLVAAGPEPDVYFYHSDHLGSASWITDKDGLPVQHLQYLPYGEPYINQRAAGTTYRERFRFTGKERDEETGYGYFGARYMDHELMTMWLSVDPLSDKYPSISPYAYCAWNPIKLVDPDGREIDDYFTRSGKYLGSDNAKTDNIRIIDESAWNELSDNGTIDHFVGNKNSESFASAHTTMSQESQLCIYQHYNPTKCKLYATSYESDPNRAGMITSTKKGVSRIGIYLEANFKGIAVANHANEIVNMFIHEGQHVIDHKKNPNMADFEYENSALMAQFHHVSWASCRLEFKKSVTEYARKASTLGSSYIDLFDPTSDIWK